MRCDLRAEAGERGGGGRGGGARGSAAVAFRRAPCEQRAERPCATGRHPVWLTLLGIAALAAICGLGSRGL